MGQQACSCANEEALEETREEIEHHQHHNSLSDERDVIGCFRSGRQ